MRTEIAAFGLLAILCLPLLGKDPKHGAFSTRYIIQVNADSSDIQKQIAHPTYAIFEGVPRDLRFRSSLTLPSQDLEPKGSWKIGITATVFWAGEPPTLNDPGNKQSAWDSNWSSNARYQNSFYVALPYNDISDGHTKPEAAKIIPWFHQAFVRDGQSVLKDRWLAIRKGTRICYAQWEDVGPFCVDHWQYVFGPERPRPNQNQNAGIDVSPAVRDYLGMSGIDSCDWRFVPDHGIPQGPWTRQHI